MRICTIPVSYTHLDVYKRQEFIRLAGRYDNRLVNILSKPGLWMQKMTTREPDDEMIEVGIASVEAVFDWRKWQKEENV